MSSSKQVDNTGKAPAATHSVGGGAESCRESQKSNSKPSVNKAKTRSSENKLIDNKKR